MELFTNDIEQHNDLILSEHNYSKNSLNVFREEANSFDSEEIIEYEEVNINEKSEDIRSFDFAAPSAVFKCPECPMILEDSLRLNRHLKLHQPPLHQCKCCLKKFKRISSVSNHRCDMIDIDMKCPICPEDCKCELDSSSSSPENCKICLLIDFRYFKDYNSHMVQNHNMVIFCKICEANNLTNLRHMKERHEVIIQYKCPQCGKKFTSKNLLNLHLKIHGKRVKLQIQKNMFPQKEWTRTRDPNEVWFRCKFCPLNFRNADNLHKHVAQTHPLNLREHLNKIKNLKFEQ